MAAIWKSCSGMGIRIAGYELEIWSVTAMYWKYGEAFIPLRKRALVSLCDATHWSRASALQTRLDAAAVNCDGLSNV